MQKNQTNRFLKLSFTDLDELYRCYMPFVSGGGLFLSTEKVYHLGETVSLLIDLPQETQPFGVEGKIVWITPAGAGNRYRIQGSSQGVGVQLVGEAARALQLKLEKLLTGRLPGFKPTHTL
jgi:type IV pilus assembly protein PilZ